MAIKERKQITGTTAQIDAYEGHEGQIVWDKEKKTFVGMSGTAGKNYPLASQAYVDTQFLPLTGGKLNGNLLFSPTARVISFDDGNEICIGQSTPFSKGGSALFLRTVNDVRPSERGSFVLAASDLNGQSNHLVGRPDGILSWAGQEVERIVARNNETYVRYSSGLQVVYIRTDASPTGYTTTFSAPFSASPIGVATHSGTANHVVITAVCSPTTLTLRTSYGAEVSAYAIIIGRWK